MREDELLAGDPKEATRRLFLGAYSAEELRLELGARGVWAALAERGFPAARLDVEPAEPAPRVAIRAGDDLLADVRASVAAWSDRRVLVIDWLELRDPRRGFSADRPRLPGQQAPGLGLGRHLVGVLVAAARRTGADALIARPHHYHNAVLYRRVGFSCADPRAEGRLDALARDLDKPTLAEASWAIDHGRLRREGSDARVDWSELADTMVLPVAPELQERFASRAYRAAARRERRAQWFTLAPAA